MRFKNYTDYLLSDKWQQVKDDYKKLSDHGSEICFFCYSRDRIQLHHWRYPKDWNNDSYKNVIALCSDCHQTAHSIEHNKMLHNSYMFDTNSDKDFIKYLSFIIKATNAMEYAFIERLADEF